MKSIYKLHPLFEDTQISKRICEHADCQQEGEYRAPKSPSQLQEYHWFCLEHVQQYNLKWDFYKRMSQEEIERSQREDITWQRPTWKFGHNKDAHKNFDINDPLNFFDGWEKQRHDRLYSALASPYSEEGQALKTLELNFPLDSANLKKRYKELAKKYHPDLNHGCQESQEMLKKINQAYSVLKKIVR